MTGAVSALLARRRETSCGNLSKSNIKLFVVLKHHLHYGAVSYLDTAYHRYANDESSLTTGEDFLCAGHLRENSTPVDNGGPSCPQLTLFFYL